MIRIDVGGNGFTDIYGNVWSADYGFQGGSTHYKALEIAGTDNDQLFYGKRYGDDFSYNIALDNGTYDVVLYMMEPNKNARIGSRVFDVSAEGTVRLDDFDMFLALGSGAAPLTALTATIANVSVIDGILNLDFSTVTGTPPNIAGIEILPSSGTPVDLLPSAMADSRTVNENSSSNTIDVLANDTSFGNGLASLTADATSANGGTVIVDNNQILYTPATDFDGTDTFNYTITDIDGDSSSAMVTVTVNSISPVDLFPSAVADSRTVNENSSSNTIDVLANDTSFGNGLASLTADATSANGGTVTVDNNQILYTPATDFDGTDTFNYTITDIDGDSSSAMVTVTVNSITPVDLFPSAVADSRTVNENSSSNTIDVLANDTSFGNGLASLTADATSANGGTVTVDNNQILYTPATDFDGTDTFNYTITDIDGDSSSAMVTVNVLAVNINPPTVTKVTASDGSANDWFGSSVYIEGNTAIIGSFRDGAGSAYIFSQGADGSWVETAKLKAGRDDFGRNVALDGNTAIIGAPGYNSGSAYIFTRQADNSWVQKAMLTPADGAKGDEFGNSVSIDGDTALIGAFGDDNGGKVDTGSAYIFTRQGDGSWTETAKLVGSGAASRDFMGRRSISINEDTAVVGAYGNGTGSVYIFTRQEDGNWLETAKLTPADGADGDEFGRNVSIDGNILVVGAKHNDETGEDSGAAYIFNRQGDGSWTQTAKLTAADATAGDRFGYSLFLKGNTLAIGAYNDDDGGIDSGSAYIFHQQDDNSWIQTKKITAPDAAELDWFGYSISTDGSNLVVGAFRDDDNGDNSGSAYIYSLDSNGAENLAPNGFAENISADENSLNNAVDVLMNPAPATGDSLIRINVGGDSFTDIYGNQWSADYGFQGGSTHYAVQEIGNTDNDELFYAKRYGTNISYDIPLANGNYDVVLHMMEPNKNATVGSHVFDVVAEDQLRLDDFHMSVALGAGAAPGTAVTATLKGVTVTDGALDLDLTTVTGLPVNFAGIEAFLTGTYTE